MSIKNRISNKRELVLTVMLFSVIIYSGIALYYYLITAIINFIVWVCNSINIYYSQLPYSYQNIVHYGSFIAIMVLIQYLLIHGMRKPKRKYLKRLHRKKVIKQTQKHINTLNQHKL